MEAAPRIEIGEFVLHVSADAPSFFSCTVTFGESVGMFNADEHRQQNDFDSVVSDFHILFARDFDDTRHIVAVDDSLPNMSFPPFESGIAIISVCGKGPYKFTASRRDSEDQHQHFESHTNTRTNGQSKKQQQNT